MRPIEKIKSALRRLDLSDHQQRIYLSLLSEGQATARVLAARTGITRPSVYDQLKSLRALGLVVELDKENKTHFAAADIKKLDALLADKIDHLNQSRDFLAEALPSLLESLETVTPKIRFFEGEEGLKQLLKDIMWHDSLTMHLLWPHEKMNAVFDAKFLTWFDERRMTRKLSIQSLWEASVSKKDTTLFTGLKQDQAKKCNSKTRFSMATIVYGKKVAFISSTTEAFGFIVESTEFSDLQRIYFSSIWHTANKI